MTRRHQGGRKGLFGQPERRQGSRKGFIGQLARHQGGRKESFGQLARHQGGRKGSIGQPARHQGGTREAGKNPLDSLGGTREAGKDQLDSLGGTREAGKDQLDSLRGTREAPPGKHQAGTRKTCSTGLPIKSRFWRGAGFCLTFNTISMANGPVRGKSWGGRHGRLPSTDCLLKCCWEPRIPFDREAPGRQERTIWTA